MLTLSDAGHKTKRWYDELPNLTESLEKLAGMPEAYQAVAGETILHFAQLQFDAQKVLADSRSLGPDKVLNLYKAKSRQRAYDKQISLHQSMNCLYALPPAFRSLLAQQMVDLTGHMEDYFSFCATRGVKPERASLVQLCQSSMMGEIQDVSGFLAKTFPDIAALPVIGPPSAHQKSVNPLAEGMVAQDNKGLKIKADLD